MPKHITMIKFFPYLLVACCISVLFSCQKEVSIETDSTLIAQGSLWDSAGACLPDSVHGTFYNGIIPGSDTAYVEIQVNVTQTGSYNITSDLQDGFQFLDSGFFSNTGINIVRLKPIGTPIIPVSTTFNISFDTTFCSFTVNVQDSTGTGLGGQQDTTGTGGGDTTKVQSGQWQFTQNSLAYGGNIDSASKDNSTGLATFVHLSGATSTGDTTMSLDFIIPAADIQPGSYTLINNGIMFSVGDIPNITTLFTASAFTTAATDFSITVASYNSTTKEIQGTFSGTAQDESGSIVPISNGSFIATIP